MAKGKIIVMRLFGGLGNQLFQYAFLFALSRQGGKARLETSSYEHDDKRVCELHHFRVSLPIEGGPPPWAFRKSRIPACLRSLFAAPKYPHFREEKRHGFDPGLAAPPRRHTYFKGYFQTEQYFLHCREQLCREFRLKTPLTPENARILEDIRSCCSISLHIRRTDYLSNPYLSPPPLEYYLRSMAEMEGRLRAAGAPQESLRYFIFSDDIEWARQNLRPALPHVHVDINDGGTGYFDLELMRNCRHHIIANSTFSWWAAWLNEHAEKIVIAPRIWLFVIAIVAHNIPEGMAVGVSAGGGMPDADSLAMGIALQDVPEGLVIALVLAGAGMSRVKAFLIGAASGLVEPVFAVLCAWLVNLAEVLLPLGLALAAGAMLLVVTQEVIPESRRNGHEKLASLGLCVGFCLMMVMDTALG